MGESVQLRDVLQAVVLLGGFLAFAASVIWKVSRMFSERDLAVAEHVRDRDAAIEKVRGELATFRAEVAEKYASKDGLSSWMRELKTDLHGRLDRIEGKVDRIAEHRGHT